MPSWSVTSEKLMSCVPEAAGGAVQQVDCSTVSGVPSTNVAAPAIAAKDRHNTTMPAASRGSVRPIDLALMPILPLLYQASTIACEQLYYVGARSLFATWPFFSTKPAWLIYQMVFSVANFSELR